MLKVLITSLMFSVLPKSISAVINMTKLWDKF